MSAKPAGEIKIARLDTLDAAELDASRRDLTALEAAVLDASITKAATSALHTYRALRVGLVAAGALLLVSVTVEASRAGAIPGSVSATFYTPARTIFTGVLLAVGLAIVVIKARPGWENGLLTAAGVLIPLVAFVPTPVHPASTLGAGSSAAGAAGVTCPGSRQSCAAEELLAGVANNVIAYAILGALALGFAWWRVHHADSRDGWDPRSRETVGAATVLWVALGLWFVVSRESFYQLAHGVSAVGFFALLIVVVVLNANAPTPSEHLTELSPAEFRRWYVVVAVLMAAAVAAAVAAFLLLGADSDFPLVFWVEVVLLMLFIGFWVLQTLELWDVAVPPSNPA